MTTSKLKIVFSVLMAALCSAYGATVRTATEGFVTNRIAQAAAAATNYTDAATTNAVKLSENKPEENARIVLWDYDAASNNPRVAAPTNIRVGDLAPGDYENISNRVMRAISLPGDDGHHPSIFGPIFKGRANLADGALALTKSGQIADPGSLQLRQRWYEDASGAISGVMWPSFLDAGNAWRWVASEDYVDAATNAIPRDFLPLSGGTMRGGVRFSYFGDYGVGIDVQHPGALVFGSNYPDYSQLKALLDLDRIPRGDPWYGQADIAFLSDIPESVTPSAVTNIIRELSLGGIWDAELEVWWTPVMVGGSLTYQATTNVNLNAEH